MNWVSNQIGRDMSYAAKSAASAVRSLIRDVKMRDLITANKFTKMSKPKDVILSFPKFDDIWKHAPTMHHLQT